GSSHPQHRPEEHHARHALPGPGEADERQGHTPDDRTHHDRDDGRWQAQRGHEQRTREEHQQADREDAPEHGEIEGAEEPVVGRDRPDVPRGSLAFEGLLDAFGDASHRPQSTKARRRGGRRRWYAPMKSSSRRPSALLLASLLAASLAGLWTASPAAAASEQWTSITYGRVQFRVPASWPVIDLAASPTACIRFDQPGVFLGRQDQQPACPAWLVGRTNAVYVQPLDGRSVARARFPRHATPINGEPAFRGLSTETGGSLVAAFPRLGVLAT